MTTLYLPGGISASFTTPEDAVAFLRAYHSGAQPVPAPPPIQPVTVTLADVSRATPLELAALGACLGADFVAAARGGA